MNRNKIERTTKLYIDLETRAAEDIGRVGIYKYVSADSFQILLCSVSINGDPVTCYDLTQKELPEHIVNMIKDPSVEKHSFNAAFERLCLSKHLGVYLSPESWRCSMVASLYLGLPGSLEKVGTFLQIEKKKLTEGKDLIRKFCIPRKSSDDNTITWTNLEDDLWSSDLFKQYNIRDVEVEVQIDEIISCFDIPEDIWKQYAIDQRINDRGVCIDKKFVEKAIECDGLSRERSMAQATELTGIKNFNSTVQVKEWLNKQNVAIASLSKSDVENAIERTTGDVQEVLRLRQQLSKTSVRKYKKMLDCLCPDGRAHGLLQFYGAARTGRWAGRLIQVQNLPQNHIAELDQARVLVSDGDYETINFFYDSVPDLLSELIRTAFVPKDGCKFIVCDYSQIEARCLAWLAGESWRMEMFARGDDLYCASASQMFGVKVEKNGENAHLRQKGKIAELALGYGGGTGAMLGMGAVKMGIPEEDLQGIVDAWRHSNPAIVQMWGEVGKSSLNCILSGTPQQYKNLVFSYESGFMFIRLPSGRRLSYPNPQIRKNNWGYPELTYEGENSVGKWGVIKTYGAKLCENIIQAIARDILAEAMIRLEAAGYPIVMHVHDEVVIEINTEARVEDVEKIMSEIPEWAEGLILTAVGYECATYRKE